MSDIIDRLQEVAEDSSLHDDGARDCIFDAISEIKKLREEIDRLSEDNRAKKKAIDKALEHAVLFLAEDANKRRAH